MLLCYVHVYNTMLNMPATKVFHISFIYTNTCIYGVCYCVTYSIIFFPWGESLFTTYYIKIFHWINLQKLSIRKYKSWWETLKRIRFQSKMVALQFGSSVGSMGPFDANKEDWYPYIEWLTHLGIANNIEDEWKLSVLLIVVGSHTYQVIRSLTAPEKPEDKTFDESVELVTRHYSQKPSSFVQRYHLSKTGRWINFGLRGSTQEIIRVLWIRCYTG